MEIRHKPYGSELWIVNTEDYCGKIIKIKKGTKNSLHCHHKKDETFYILKGKIKLTVESTGVTMNPGDEQRVKPGLFHRFEALEDSEIIEFSTHHDEDDVERITEKKTYCFDIDGTICSIETPENYRDAKPYNDRIQKINKLHDEGHMIYFYTGRHMLQSKITQKWLKENGVRYDDIFFGKPIADKYIDDLGETPEYFFQYMI